MLNDTKMMRIKPPVARLLRRKQQHDRHVMPPQAAFTLVELAIVLGVFGLILAGIWFAYAGLQNRMKVNKAIQQLQIIANNMRSLYGTAGQTDTPAGAPVDQTARLVRQRVFPPDMLVPGEPYPQGPWGGVRIEFNPTSPNPDQTQYMISFNDVVNPGAVPINTTTRTVPCGELMTSASSAARDLGLLWVYNIAASSGDWLDANALNPDSIADCAGPVFLTLTFR
jgi:type II secretory pathway pseudopilin PulG